MTGRINFTPEAGSNSINSTNGSPRRRRLTPLGASSRRSSTTSTASWCSRSPAERATTYDRACGRPRYKKRTLVAYEVDESSGELVVNILGVFHGGQDWEAALSEDQDDPEAGR